MLLIKFLQYGQLGVSDFIQPLRENFPVKIRLAVEVVVDRGDVGTGGFGNLADADAVKAVGEKELFCTLKQCGPGVFRLFAVSFQSINVLNAV